MKVKKYAVMIEPFESDDFDYVRDGCGAMWTNETPVKTFDTEDAAYEEAKKWNTGKVVQYE